MRARYGLPEDYLLWVGGLEHPDPRKRVAALAGGPARAAARARRAPPEAVGARARRTSPSPDTSATTSSPRSTPGARALVFPSDDEGFGLPPVEALACGTPVVACDVPALREVLGDRATFVDRDDLAGLAGRRRASSSARPPHRRAGPGRTQPARPGTVYAEAA